MLRGVQNRAVWDEPARSGGGFGRRRRNVLELERHDVHATREYREPRPDRRKTRRTSRSATWPVGVSCSGDKRVDAIAHAPRRDREHAPQLPAAQHADGGARRESAASRQLFRANFRGLLVAKLAQLLAQRRVVIGEDRDGQQRRVVRARLSRSPSVPTGMPPGICTIDSSESMPFSAWLSTGTPNTGSSVLAATMPGRCAAPPAPAMITCKPRACRARRILDHPDPACDAPTRPSHSCATPKRVSISAACRIVSQSDLLPMMMPTSGCMAGYCPHTCFGISQAKAPAPPVGQALTAASAASTGRSKQSSIWLLSLRDHGAGLAVKRAQRLGFDDIHALIEHAPQQRDGLFRRGSTFRAEPAAIRVGA